MNIRRVLCWPDEKIAQILCVLIRWYQKTISPDHSVLGKATPFCGCRFWPSCSEYAIQAFQQKGFVMGIWPVLWRVLRCNPWNKGGVDRVH
jgi:uncharacterized protein